MNNGRPRAALKELASGRAVIHNSARPPSRTHKPFQRTAGSSPRKLHTMTIHPCPADSCRTDAGHCTLLLCAALVAGTLSLIASVSAADAARPNLLLIMADDVGREALGCYGGTSYETPRLDQLAGGGMRFAHGYVMPVCHPTRVSLLTGRYPSSLGNPGWGSFPKNTEDKTIAQVLRSAGYATAIAGKWQLALLKKDPAHPHRLGFDQYSLFGWHEGPRYFDPMIYQNGKVRDDLSGRYGPDVYTDFLIEFMKTNREGPFFAFYSMALCHDVTDDLDAPPPLGPRGRYESYAEMVASMDRQVGKLIDALDKLDLRKETLVLFITDNGTPKSYIATAKEGKLVRQSFRSEWQGEQVRGGKGDLTDLGTRVPWIASWPGKIEPQQVVDDLVDVTDILPTLAELAGADLPQDVKLDGASFAPVLTGNGPGQRSWVHAEHRGRRFVRNRNYKLYDDGQFYDMQHDPTEQEPLSTDSLSPEAQAAHKKLKAAMVKLESK